MAARSFRLFLSSTFSDFRHERQALHRRTVPVLQQFCRERGAEFELVDLRWGISREAQREHRTLDICLGEIRRCRQLGLPPHFALLLGDRYGWEPLPASIDELVWQRLAVSAGDDAALLDAHYERDLNAVPPCRMLRRGPIDLADQDRLLALLRRLADSAGLAPHERPPLFTSATHQEIIAGALALPAGTDLVSAYLRGIDGLPVGPEAGVYADLADGWHNAAAHERLNALKAEVRAHLAPGQVHEFTASWHGSDIGDEHLDAFCERFIADQQRLIERSLASHDRWEAEQSLDDRHRAFGAARATVLHGRAAEIAHITDYTQAPAAGPLVVIGEGGIGKSALLHEAARAIEAAAPTAVVLLRFIGGVPGDERLEALLQGLIDSIHAACGETPPGPAIGFEALRSVFASALALGRVEKPLVLVIDGLDQLPAGDTVRELQWLPSPLPAAAHVILSTREGRLADAARRHASAELLTLTPLPAADASAMLQCLLLSAGRRLTATQAVQVLDGAPSLPLWLKLAFEEVRHWRSSDPGVALPHDIAALVRARIDSLAMPQNHGPQLVREAMALIAAGRFGLAESELAAALSRPRAPQVWAEFGARSHHAWSELLLPQILWSRLYADLAPYLTGQASDGTVNYRYFHREFQQVVAADFLAGAEGEALHARLADLFAEPDGDALYRSCDASRATADSRALRRLGEQPWQLAQAGKRQELAALLNDLSFVTAKLAANRVADLMADIAELERLAGRAGHAVDPWCRRLRAWRPLLEQADASWPAHRVLAQLLLEADPQLPQHIGMQRLLEAAPPNWPLLLATTPQHYIDPPLAVIDAPEAFAGLAVLAPLFVAVWDAAGSFSVIDTSSGLTIEQFSLPSLDRLDIWAEHYRQLRGEAVAPPLFGKPQRGGKVSLQLDAPAVRLDWQWAGCLQVSCGEVRTELILGRDHIQLLGETADQLLFLCDHRIAVIDRAGLGRLPPGLYSYQGLRIDGLAIDGDEGSWNHERFNSVLFLDAAHCVTLGFALGGAQRDDVILESYRIGDGRIEREAIATTDHDLDLPIWQFSALSDGSLVLASERYFHTFIWRGPRRGVEGVEMLPGAAVGNNELGNWFRKSGEGVGMTFVARDPAIATILDAPGEFGSAFGDSYIPDGMWRLDADDFSGSRADFAGLETEDAQGRLARWHCDVQPKWMFARPNGDYIVFKNSGPVIVRERNSW